MAAAVPENQKACAKEKEDLTCSTDELTFPYMAIKSKRLSKTTTSAIESKPEEQVAYDNSPVELGFVIDKSYSMAYLKQNLIASFNTLLDEQNAPNVQASLSLFSSDVAIVADRIPVSILSKLNNTTYHPDGQTALLDGIGSMIFMMDRQNTGARKLIAIFTDGMENCSRNFDLEQIMHEIKTRQEQGWKFIFITPLHGIPYAEKLGIPRDHIVDFTLSGEGLKSIMDRLSKAVKAYRIGDVTYTLFLLEDKSKPNEPGNS
jgi:hypothetical protein